MEKDPKLRPLYLAQILYERTDEDHYLTTAQLMEILEKEYGIKTHRQTIPADVAALRSFGMEIQEVMSAQKRYNLISREYDIAEIKLLIDAVESSKFITKKKSEELVAKLSKMAGRNQAEQLRRNISAEDRIKYDNESIYLIIDGINEAINAGKKISFLYYEFTAAKKKRLKNGGEPYVFSPYTLTWNGDCYYMVGWSDKHGKIATFRVDRIFETPTILKDPAVPKPKDYSIAEFSEKAFQLFDGERTEVTLLCHESTMNSVLDHFGDHVKTELVDDTHFRLTAEVSLSPTFFAWVFQFDGRVQVRGPAKAERQYLTLISDKTRKRDFSNAT